MAAVTKVKSSGNKTRAAAPQVTLAKPAKPDGKAAKPGKPAKAAKAAKAAPGKPAKAARDGARQMKDTFRMPLAEFERLRALKQRARALGRPAKKSELLRAGLQLLAASDDDALLAALGTTARR